MGEPFLRLSGLTEARPIAAFDFDGTLREHRGVVPPIAGKHILAAWAPFRRVLIFSNRSVSKDRRGPSGDPTEAERCPSGRRSGDPTEVEEAALAPLLDFVATLPESIRAVVDMMAALGTCRFRKPLRAAWDLYLQKLDEQGARPSGFQLALSFYCGDAAGRGAGGGRKKDFAGTDRWFAYNAGLQFYTPEGLLGYPDRPLSQENQERLAIINGASAPSVPSEAFGKALECSLVVLCGLPGAGKSHFADALMARGYRILSNDVDVRYRRRPGLLMAEAARYLDLGERVAVDNVNGLREQRRQLLALSPSSILVWVDAPPWLRTHNDYGRVDLGIRKAPMSRMAVMSLQKKFESPQAENCIRVPGRPLPGAGVYLP